MASITSATGGSSTQLVAVWSAAASRVRQRASSPSASAISASLAWMIACTPNHQDDCFSSSWASRPAQILPAAAVSPSR